MALVMAAASLVAAATLFGGYSTSTAAASTPVVPERAVEKKIVAIGKKTIDNPTTGIFVKSAKCPHDLKGKVGTTMICKLTKTGQNGYGLTVVQVFVTVSKVHGKNIIYGVNINPG
jgi:Domain of unknown function (DUF4333)